MQIRLSKKDHENLKLAAEHMGLSMSALFREGLSRLLAGKIELPTKDTPETIHTIFTLSRVEEDQMRNFAEESHISLAEAGRIIVMDMLKQLSAIITRAEALTTRKEALLAREEALMTAKENHFHEQKNASNTPKKALKNTVFHQKNTVFNPKNRAKMNTQHSSNI